VNVSATDIAVVGAGLVGLSACALLENQGYRVALIDPSAGQTALPDPYDLRTYALTPASMRLFDRLGVGAAMQATRIAQFHGMRVWDANSDGVIEFGAAALGRECLGYVVEHANLICALNAVLAVRSGVTRITGRVNALHQGDAGVRLGLDTGAELRASLVLGCDGANSGMRELLGLLQKARDYVQHALVCNVEVECDHDNIARQRFLGDGPLAFLPLPEARMCAVVWSTTPERAAHAASASDDDFMTMLGTAFGHTLGKVRATSERLALPLQTLHTGQYAVDRAVLLGDAAHVVHPLAGQGLNLGLMDAAALAEVLGPRDDLTLKLPHAALRRFERMRRGENLVMLKVTDQINRLFRDEHPLVRRVRGFGMTAIGGLVPLKHWLILRAMGDVGDVPAIAARR